MKGGKVHSKRIDFPRGDPGNPMSFEDVIEKLKKCLPYSLHPLNGKKKRKELR
jgi:2-methylcitrate dehydratase PrpD